jgi:hypothetical protein
VEEATVAASMRTVRYDQKSIRRERRKKIAMIAVAVTSK